MSSSPYVQKKQAQKDKHEISLDEDDEDLVVRKIKKKSKTWPKVSCPICCQKYGRGAGLANHMRKCRRVK